MNGLFTWVHALPVGMLCLQKWQCSTKILVKQQNIEQQDNNGAEYGQHGGYFVVDQCTHDRAAAGEDDQRDYRNRQDKAQNNLADYQGLRGIPADGHYDQGRKHGQQTAQPDRDGKPTKPCMMT